MREQKAKLIIDAMPVTMQKGFKGGLRNQGNINEEGFIRQNQEEVEIILEDNLIGDDG